MLQCLLHSHEQLQGQDGVPRTDPKHGGHHNAGVSPGPKLVGHQAILHRNIMADGSENRRYGEFRLVLAGHWEKFTLRLKIPTF